AQDALRQQVVSFIQRLRERDLYKAPGVAESIDWTHALLALDQHVLEPDAVDATLGVVLKYQDDIESVRGEEANALLKEATEALRP
ncbi:MAG: MoxR family ATPase, partial [Myxococcota bacterium]